MSAPTTSLRIRVRDGARGASSIRPSERLVPSVHAHGLVIVATGRAAFCVEYGHLYGPSEWRQRVGAQYAEALHRCGLRSAAGEPQLL